MHEAPLQALLPALEGSAVEIRNVVEGQGNKKLFQLHRTGWPTCGLPRSLVHHSRTPHIIVAQLLSFIPSPLGSANQFAEGALQKVYFGTSNRRFMARADDHFGGHERLGLVDNYRLKYWRANERVGRANTPPCHSAMNKFWRALFGLRWNPNQVSARLTHSSRE